MKSQAFVIFLYQVKKIKKRGRRSGGIIIYYKDHLQIGLSLEHDSDNIVWFKLDSKLFNLEKPLYIASVYIPPNKGSAIKFFSRLLDDILHYTNLGDIILTGDFNARTSTLPDFVLHDDSSVDKNYCQTPDNYIHDQSEVRNNLDCTTNESGKLLAQLCAESGVNCRQFMYLVISLLVLRAGCGI